MSVALGHAPEPLSALCHCEVQDLAERLAFGSGTSGIYRIDAAKRSASLVMGTPYVIESIACGDLNGDALPDLVGVSADNLLLLSLGMPGNSFEDFRMIESVPNGSCLRAWILEASDDRSTRLVAALDRAVLLGRWIESDGSLQWRRVELSQTPLEVWRGTRGLQNGLWLICRSQVEFMPFDGTHSTVTEINALDHYAIGDFKGSGEPAIATIDDLVLEVWDTTDQEPELLGTHWLRVRPRYILVGDFDRDERDDLFIAGREWGDIYYGSKNGLRHPKRCDWRTAGGSIEYAVLNDRSYQYGDDRYTCAVVRDAGASTESVVMSENRDSETASRAMLYFYEPSPRPEPIAEEREAIPRAHVEVTAGRVLAWIGIAVCLLVILLACVILWGVTWKYYP